LITIFSSDDAEETKLPRSKSARKKQRKKARAKEKNQENVKDTEEWLENSTLFDEQPKSYLTNYYFLYLPSSLLFFFRKNNSKGKEGGAKALIFIPLLLN
jgi:hypothetical protein